MLAVLLVFLIAFQDVRLRGSHEGRSEVNTSENVSKSSSPFKSDAAANAACSRFGSCEKEGLKGQIYDRTANPASLSVEFNLYRISGIIRKYILLTWRSVSNRDSRVSKQVSFDVALLPVCQPIFDVTSKRLRTLRIRELGPLVKLPGPSTLVSTLVKRLML